VFTIQTLKSTITFLGVPPTVSPLFMALVVVIVVLVQSQRVRDGVGRAWDAITSSRRSEAEVTR
jgi:simple sugar transport system permease protein